ncbi:MAG: D-aminoacyl-tRNA deacylase [Candidatus Pacearchaeota archaeon]
MTYQKYLIIASKKDPAGVNITTQLSQFRNPLLSSMKNSPSFDFYLREEEIVSDENLDLDKISKYDFIIFASKHQSKEKIKSLSIHAPGNWKKNEFGGKEGKICPTSAVFQKQLFENLNKQVNEDKLKKYQVTLECTHHGPLINKPCIFIEIGSTETEWKDRRAGFTIAKTIVDTIENFKENPYNEIVIGIGGPHYCPNFNKIQLNSNYAISHIIPGYTLPLTEEMIKEAIEKTKEEIDFVLLDWKGLTNAEERGRITKILDKFYLKYKKTSEIKK